MLRKTCCRAHRGRWRPGRAGANQRAWRLLWFSKPLGNYNTCPLKASPASPARPTLCYLDAVILVTQWESLFIFFLCVCVWEREIAAPTCLDKPSLCGLSRFHLWWRLKWRGGAASGNDACVACLRLAGQTGSCGSNVFGDLRERVCVCTCTTSLSLQQGRALAAKWVTAATPHTLFVLF